MFYDKDSSPARSLKKAFSLAYLITFFREEKFFLTCLSGETFNFMPSKKYEEVRNQGRKKDRSKIFQGFPTYKREIYIYTLVQASLPESHPQENDTSLQLLQSSISTNLLAPGNFTNAVPRDFSIQVVFMDYMYIIFVKIRKDLCPSTFESPDTPRSLL